MSNPAHAFRRSILLFSLNVSTANSNSHILLDALDFFFGSGVAIGIPKNYFIDLKHWNGVENC